MTFDQLIIGILVLVIIILEILHQLQVNKLVNKLMSRNYYDYQVTKGMDSVMQKPDQVKIPTEEVEDFAHMSDYINNVM